MRKCVELLQQGVHACNIFHSVVAIYLIHAQLSCQNVPTTGNPPVMLPCSPCANPLLADTEKLYAMHSFSWSPLLISTGVLVSKIRFQSSSELLTESK